MEEQRNNRSKWLHLRLTPKEYEKVHRRFLKTTHRKLSDFARKNLLRKPVVMNYRNQSLDDFIQELIQLRKELNAIGNNFNQAVKKLHTLDKLAEFRHWITTYELEKKILYNKVDEIKKHIQNAAEKWLQS